MCNVKKSAHSLSRIVEYSGNNASNLADLYAIDQELRFVIEASTRLAGRIEEKSSDQIEMRALYSGALQAYARCFTSSKRKTLDPEIYSSLGGEPLACHEMYIGMRNKHLAHSVNAFEQIKVGLSLAPEDKRREILDVGCFTLSLIYADAENMLQLSRLALIALKYIETQIEDLQKTIIKEANQKDINLFYAQPNLRFTGGKDTNLSR